VDLVRTALKDASSRCDHPLPDSVTFVTTVGSISLAWILHENGEWPEENFVELAQISPATSQPQ
jgi:hypothetical protein